MLDLPSPYRDATATGRPAEIEEPLNRWLIHRVSQRLLPHAIAAGVHPNLVSALGLAFGLGAAACYWHWRDPLLVLAGFGLMLAWHVCDGLDGQLARATGTASPFGQFVDGLCDYATYIAVYLAIAYSIEGPWILALCWTAGGAHAVQAAWYEAERAAYARRIKGDFVAMPPAAGGGPLRAAYVALQSWLSAPGQRADARLRADPERLPAYTRAVQPILARAVIFGPTFRTIAIALFMLAGAPVWFWLIELFVWSPLALLFAWWLRRAEARF